VEIVAEELDELWAEVFARVELTYDHPEAVAFDGSVQTGCGPAKAGQGSFYCPADVSVYLDLDVLAEIADEYGAVAVIMAVAREYGHYVEALDGYTDRAESDPAAPRQLAADCWAGWWIIEAELTGLMSAGVAAEVVSFLGHTTAASTDTANPASLRVGTFLTGYYLQSC
jgi:predicted metalloprotease